MAEIYLPEDLEERCHKEHRGLQGVFALEGELKDWLEAELNV